MLKKLFCFALGILFLGSLAQAQDFEITINPIYDTTAGVTPYDGSQGEPEHIDMKNYVKNLTDGNLILNWRNITDTTQNPSGWYLLGVCDNITCYISGTETLHQSAPVNPDANMLLECRIYASTDEPDGVGTYKIEVKTLNQTDTAVFILTKDESTGISAIPLDDKRVSIYPNPVVSGSDIHVYIDQNLKASRATVYSIIGREQLSVPVARNKDLTRFNVDRLPAGLYILRLTDEQGQTITSRKFSKK